eukprot:NODE_264_length_1725_cov_311.572455.p2 GENE.NODE_264_length_1725_cov_311.572455~~NODE_264_length_1725_cov_311.572455.p2  ORF type:complete len:290 (-),score=109.35 NODE_264_length_1725_cov_311.572455:329-1198(-)
MAVFRALRVLRLVRVLRIVRVMRFFTVLRVMVMGIKSSLQPLCWCLTLLLLVMFIFGTVIMQLLSSEYEGASATRQSFIKDHFGTMLQTLYTLHISITGGLDWSYVSDMLFRISLPVAIAYMFYIVFALFCVLNVVTGIFVEAATASVQSDAEHQMVESVWAQTKMRQVMSDVFMEMDVTGAGKVSCAEFVKYVDDERVQAFMHCMGLDVNTSNADAIFHLVDLDGDGGLDKDEFLDGVTHFSGVAKQMDMARVTHALRDVQRNQLQLMAKLEVTDDERALPNPVNVVV